MTGHQEVVYILEFVERHGNALLFLWAFAEQSAVPVPSAPLLLAAGALIHGSRLQALPALASCTLGALLADNVWFVLGRRRGARFWRRAMFSANNWRGRSRSPPTWDPVSRCSWRCWQRRGSAGSCLCGALPEAVGRGTNHPDGVAAANRRGARHVYRRPLEPVRRRAHPDLGSDADLAGRIDDTRA